MPYIEQKNRFNLDKCIDELVKVIDDECEVDVDFAGILNYTITTLINKFIQKRFGKIRYWVVAMIDGVLSGVSREFYRRKAAPYEDKKIKENGDVFGYGD